MKVAIIGATGRTGKYLVKQALARGIEVTALVRNSKSLSDLAHGNLKVVEVDIFSSEELIPHIGEVCCVFSVLGSSQFRAPWGEETLFTASSRATIDAMNATSKTRYCVLTCATVDYDSMTKNPSKHKLVLNMMNIPAAKDVKKMEKFLTNDCDGISFTIFRATVFLDDPEPWDMEPIFVEDVGHESEDGCQIPRANVAKVMLDSIDDEKTFRKSMYLSMPKKK